jgi:hypothetical protein
LRLLDTFQIFWKFTHSVDFRISKIYGNCRRLLGCHLLCVCCNRRSKPVHFDNFELFSMLSLPFLTLFLLSSFKTKCRYGVKSLPSLILYQKDKRVSDLSLSEAVDVETIKKWIVDHGIPVLVTVCYC